MAAEVQDSRMVLAAGGDLIRIVPLHLPDEFVGAPAAAPHLTFRGGPLLTAVEVFTVFWGAAWQRPPQSDMAQMLTCGVCGLAMFGVYQKAGEGRRYYVCRGKDRLLSARTELCPRSQVRAEDIEAAVWAHIVGVLTDPTALVARFAEHARLATEGDAHERATAEALRVRPARLEREDGRLL